MNTSEGQNEAAQQRGERRAEKLLPEAVRPGCVPRETHDSLDRAGVVEKHRRPDGHQTAQPRGRFALNSGQPDQSTERVADPKRLRGSGRLQRELQKGWGVLPDVVVDAVAGPR